MSGKVSYRTVGRVVAPFSFLEAGMRIDVQLFIIRDGKLSSVYVQYGWMGTRLAFVEIVRSQSSYRCKLFDIQPSDSFSWLLESVKAWMREEENSPFT